MLLPHGYDGNGPEHSSCRMERYLQMCDDNETPPKDFNEELDKTRKANMLVVNATTAANYFHALRRQMVRNFRKPLVVVAPKKLLKLREAGSDMSEFDEGTKFTKVYTDTWSERVPDDKVRRVVFCSGQVYYDLIHDREQKGLKDIAIVRMEQLSPFPWSETVAQLKKFKNADIFWAQEEHKNMGGY